MLRTLRTSFGYATSRYMYADTSEVGNYTEQLYELELRILDLHPLERSLIKNEVAL